MVFQLLVHFIDIQSAYNVFKWKYLFLEVYYHV